MAFILTQLQEIDALQQNAYSMHVFKKGTSPYLPINLAFRTGCSFLFIPKTFILFFIIVHGCIMYRTGTK